MWFHGVDAIPTGDPNTYVGSPMYEVVSEHAAGLLMVGILVLFAWWTRRRAGRSAWATSLRDGYRSLDSVHRLLAWLIAISGAVHLGLVLGHEPYVMSVLWLLAGVAMLAVARRLLLGRRWRRWAALVLLGSVLGYVTAMVAGEPPDQVAIATKLVELFALAIVTTPVVAGKRLRRLAASTVLVLLVVITALGSWIGAFAAGDGGHHLGEVPPPGVLLPTGEDRDPTAHEIEEAGEFYRRTVAAISRYDDVDVARAAGYQVDGMFGRDFHAANPGYQADGRIFDPERPETLVYTMQTGRPVLLGAMFEMPEIGQPGPAIGGPLTVWHAHDHVCFSLTPPALAGLVSPFGSCPIGALAIPKTPEMIHVWTLPGAPEPYGELDEEWLAAYLEG